MRGEIVCCGGLGGDLSGGMAVHLSVQNFLCVRLLSGNANSKI